MATDTVARMLALKAMKEGGGTAGPPGPPGKPGIGIKDVEISPESENDLGMTYKMEVVLDNDVPIDAGDFLAPRGPQGKEGSQIEIDGTVVDTVSFNSDPQGQITKNAQDIEQLNTDISNLQTSIGDKIDTNTQFNFNGSSMTLTEILTWISNALTNGTQSIRTGAIEATGLVESDTGFNIKTQ